MNLSAPILPGSTIGVLGSGQLGRMFAIAARRMGYRVHTFSPDEDTPTGQVSDLEIQAPYADLDAVRQFASNVSVVTFEFENVPAETAAAAAACAPVRPAGEILHTTQHRLREKSFLTKAGLPLTSFRRVASLPDLELAVSELGFPAILKSADFGYDGKGQFRILNQSQLVAAWQVVGPNEAVLEAFVDFDREISVVAARSANGDFVHYGAIENQHVNGILDLSLSPACLAPALAQQAVEITRAVFEQLNVVGVLCVEFFVTKSGQLLINELAPRPHNSGHLTLDANVTSQFEQQLRCVCGLPLGDVAQLTPSAMANLLGDLWTPHEPNWPQAAAIPNVKIHLYGKLSARPGRKMGHLTALSNNRGNGAGGRRPGAASFADVKALNCKLVLGSLLKICYFDAFSGISGDMTVGALLDAGADWAALESALHSLNLGATLTFEKTKRKGISGGKFSVTHPEQKKHRHLPHIQKIIAAGELSESSRRNSLAIFDRLAAAESKAHNVPLESVHFHEVGAIDSICDIVGACVALDLLAIAEVYCSRINVGSGTVESEHGTLPVPAPATTELLKNKPIYAAGPVTELTTPTGAAIVSALSKGFGAMPPMHVLSQGFGAGDKEFPMQANLLRVLIGERTAASESTTVSVIEANIDDSTPQVLGYAMERLLAEGALDVTLSPLFMKKNRPATLLSVISTPELAEKLAAIVFAETSTLGMRIHQAERRVLARTISQVETPYGQIHIKHAENGSFTPEFEDCRRAAIAHNVPLRTVISAAVKK